MDDSFRLSARLAMATYAESIEQIRSVVFLVQSLRTFGGRFSQAPIWVYIPAELPVDAILESTIINLAGSITRIIPPEEARYFFYATTPTAAARAESQALRREYEFIVWLDADTIFLAEPSAFDLDRDVELACRPVMHNRSGSLCSQAPDKYWERIYELLGLTDVQLFPITTPADHQKIRAYFNAGLLVARPENGILAAWTRDFHKLATDPLLKKICHEEINRNIFLFQTALVGAVLRRLSRPEILLLSDAYNYPLFFNQMYAADLEFDDLSQVITLRHDYYFRDPAPDWSEKLKGERTKIDWLRERLGQIEHHGV